MRKLAATVCALVLVSSMAYAQAPSCVASDPTAVPVDTIRTTLTIAPPDSTSGDSSTAADQPKGGALRAKAKSNGQITLEICIWRTQMGIVYSITPSSFTFGGDGSVIDSLLTSTIFDLASQTAIGQGIVKGYSTCSADCSNNIVLVQVPSCVQRTGGGISTQFISCETGSCCMRSYNVCCPDGSGAPTLQLVGTSGGGCGASSGSGCESLCE